MASTVGEPVTTASPGRAEIAGSGRPRGNPWRRPWAMEGFIWLYIVWSIVPIAIAVLFSFNKGASQATWQGFSTKWYVGSGVTSVLHNPSLHQAVVQTLVLAVLTTVICVPIGVCFAIGIDRWRTRSASGLNFVMIFSFVIPELLLAVALFLLVTQALTFINLGTPAEVAGLVVWNISWPAIIVRARLISIGRTYEEAAADLGASRIGAIRRVLLPMLMPAIFASAVLVFASTVDDFVIVEQLSSTENTQPMSVLIYSNVHGGLSGPALNALATIMLVISLLAALIGFIGYRWMSRGERTEGGADALTEHCGNLRGTENEWRTCQARVTDEALRRCHRGRRDLGRDPGRRVLLAARGERVWQDDHAADGRGLRAADQRQDPARRHRRRGLGAQPPQCQHGLPELRAVPVPDRRRERCVWHEVQVGGEVRARQPGGGGPRDGPAVRVREATPEPALRRPATTRRAGAGTGAASVGPAAGRAPWGAGREAPPDAPGRVGRAPEAGWESPSCMSLTTRKRRLRCPIASRS